MVSCRSLLALCSLAIVLVVVHCKKSHDEEWEDWKAKHGMKRKSFSCFFSLPLRLPLI